MKNLKITAFDRQVLKQLQSEIDAALKPVADKFGIVLTSSGGRFDNTTFTARIKFSLPPTSEVAMQEGERFSKMLGFNENIIGKTLTDKGREYTVIKIDISKPKYAIVCSGGVAFSTDSAKRQLNK